MGTTPTIPRLPHMYRKKCELQALKNLFMDIGRALLGVPLTAAINISANVYSQKSEIFTSPCIEYQS